MPFIKTSEGTRQGDASSHERYPTVWKCPGCKDECKSYWRNCPACSTPRPKA